MSDIDTAELRRLYAESNNPYAKPGPAAVAAIEVHARVPALLNELDRLRERVKALAPDHGFNSERSQRAENGGRP